MNTKQNIAIILAIGAIVIASVALVTGVGENIGSDVEKIDTKQDRIDFLENELKMVKSYDDFKYEEWKKNQHKDTIIGCGETTQLRNGVCYPLPTV